MMFKCYLRNYSTHKFMTTYLIKWNPKNGWKTPHHPRTLEQDVENVRRKGFIDLTWSCGNTKKIQKGDRIFMLRTGVSPRGIMASGIVTKEPYEGSHWDISRLGDTALYIGVRFDALFDPEYDGILETEQLKAKHLTNFTWHTPPGGLSFSAPAAAELEAAWSAFLTGQKHRGSSSPDKEGAKPSFQISRSYTRNQIHKVLGGNLEQYLPTVDGRVVCACLQSKYNPEAPDVILVGDSPEWHLVKHFSVN